MYCLASWRWDLQWVVLPKSLNTFAENRVPTRSSIFTLYLQHHKMTTTCRILGDIDPNITSRGELSPYLRGVIAGRAQGGGKPTLIANAKIDSFHHYTPRPNSQRW